MAQIIGRHYLLDLHGVEISLAKDSEKIKQLLLLAAKSAGATALYSHFHSFGEGGGVTGVVLLCESHISIHTWPEQDFAAVDLFMCGDSSPERAAELLIKAFQATHHKLRICERGL